MTRCQLRGLWHLAGGQLRGLWHLAGGHLAGGWRHLAGATPRQRTW